MDVKTNKGEGWKVLPITEKDQTANPEKFYLLKNPNPNGSNIYVRKDMGFEDLDGTFHYYARYMN